MAWEGAELPARPSLRGELNTAVNELRDPAVFRDSDGSLWLLYTGGGEQAIGLARLQLPDCNSDDEPKKQGSDSSPQQLAAVT
jgi:beta-xylosidase